MGGIFGKAWYEQHGPEANSAWGPELGRLTFERAAAILAHYTKSGDQYPPNLSQVMKLSREIANRPDPHKKMPAPKVGAGEVAEHIEHTAKARSSSNGGRRSVLLPGESCSAYLSALAASGKSGVEFDAERLALNGWTQENETSFQRHAARVGFRLGEPRA